MKKLRRVARDIDPETGDVSYFKAGPSSRDEALSGQRKPSGPTKGQKARRKRRHREYYQNRPPRPLFDTPTPEPSARVRRRMKRLTFKRDQHRCQQCGTCWNLTLDHIVPVSKGGGWHLNNLQCLCYDCNQAKGNKMPYELAA